MHDHGAVVVHVDKTTDSQSWGLRFESAGSGSSVLGRGTLSSLPSPSERINLKPLVSWLLACNQLAFLVARLNKISSIPFHGSLVSTPYIFVEKPVLQTEYTTKVHVYRPIIGTRIRKTFPVKNRQYSFAWRITLYFILHILLFKKKSYESTPPPPKKKKKKIGLRYRNSGKWNRNRRFSWMRLTLFKQLFQHQKLLKLLSRMVC